MAFCSLLEHPVLARPGLPTGRFVSGTGRCCPSAQREAFGRSAHSGSCLRQRADLPPPGRLRRTSDCLRFFCNSDRKSQSPSTNLQSQIPYHVIDATNEQELLSLGEHRLDVALSNMALFDMADIETLFRTLPRLLKPNGSFVFSLAHPAFNNASSMHVAEEMDWEGEIKTVYSVKISRYMTPYHAKGLALRNQPKPQMYFERPLQYYLNLGFQNGFVLDGFVERAFPLGWGGNFSEIPPVLIARFRKV